MLCFANYFCRISDLGDLKIKETKKPIREGQAFLNLLVSGAILSRRNCFNRAYISAGTAIGADIGVDFIDITFGDSFNRTLVNASSASGAVVRNNVSHFVVVLKFVLQI